MWSERDQPEDVTSDVQQLLRPVREILLQHLRRLQDRRKGGKV